MDAGVCEAGGPGLTESPLKAWREAVKSMKEAKTYENAVDVQREGRNLSDWCRQNIRLVK